MPVMDLTDVIASFATGTYAVRRRASSTYTDGYLDPDSFTTLSVTGCLQPVTGRELQRMPEGWQDQEVQQLWSPIYLRTKQDDGAADVLEIDGVLWEVQKCERWDTLGAYWRAYMMKVEPL